MKKILLFTLKSFLLIMSISCSGSDDNDGGRNEPIGDIIVNLDGTVYNFNEIFKGERNLSNRTQPISATTEINSGRAIRFTILEDDLEDPLLWGRVDIIIDGTCYCMSDNFELDTIRNDGSNFNVNFSGDLRTNNGEMINIQSGTIDISY